MVANSWKGSPGVGPAIRRKKTAMRKSQIAYPRGSQFFIHRLAGKCGKKSNQAQNPWNGHGGRSYGYSQQGSAKPLDSPINH
jgi:hypothetical protein